MDALLPDIGVPSERLLQCLRRLPHSAKVLPAIARITDAYHADDEPWVLGYSGGKDSTAVLKLVFQALLRTSTRHKPISVVYCDTGVEIPLAASLAKSVLKGVRQEGLKYGLPIRTQILSPPIEERFFVKVLGRGYPPPTDKFRWCTDRLRIDPVTRFLQARALSSATVVLGVRETESATRRKTLAENHTAQRYWRRQRGIAARKLFVPILDFTTDDVWQTNLLIRIPESARAQEVANLYANASGECPTVRDVRGAPCGKARFGCWTCTVAKRGVTLRNLIAAGNESLGPLLEYRLWLEAERNNPSYRWPNRRNGAEGLGPMTIEWRKLALDKLLSAQAESGLCLIGTDEIEAIRAHWEQE